MIEIDLFNVLKGGGTNCFGEYLMKLILKADENNLEKLFREWHEEVKLVEKWRQTGKIRINGKDMVIG